MFDNGGVSRNAPKRYAEETLTKANPATASIGPDFQFDLLNCHGTCGMSAA